MTTHSNISTWICITVSSWPQKNSVSLHGEKGDWVFFKWGSSLWLVLYLWSLSADIYWMNLWMDRERTFIAKGTSRNVWSADCLILSREEKEAWQPHKITTFIGVTMLKAMTSHMMLSKNVYSHVVNRCLKSYMQMSNWISQKSTMQLAPPSVTMMQTLMSLCLLWTIGKSF